MKIQTVYLFLAAMFVGCTAGGGNGDLTEESQPESFKAYAVFRWSQDLSSAVELFAVNEKGTGLVNLSGKMIEEGGVQEFHISPDGSRAAFLADRETEGVAELYVVLIDGGEVVKVSVPLTPEGMVLDFAWSPDSKSLAYRIKSEPSAFIVLYVGMADGSGSEKVSALVASEGSVFQYSWSPDSTRLAFSEMTLDFNSIQTYTVKPDGSEWLRITAFGDATGVDGPIKWAPDGSRIAFRADPGNSGEYRLYTALPTLPIDLADLTGSQIVGSAVTDFEWAPNSSRIAYLVDQFVDDQYELFSSAPDADIGGTTNSISGGIIIIDKFRINGTLAPDADVLSFRWSPDSIFLAYLIDSIDPSVQELHRAYFNGTWKVKISGDVDVSTGEGGYEWAPDGELIAFLGGPGDDQLYTNTPQGQFPVKVSGPMEPGGRVYSFHWDPSGGRLAFWADKETVDVPELFTTPAEGAGEISKVNSALPADYITTEYKWTLDGERLTYRVVHDQTGVGGIWSAAYDGSNPRELTKSLSPEGIVEGGYELVPR